MQVYYLTSPTPEVVPGRLELPTSTLSVWRSNQLSYRTVFKRRDPDEGMSLISNIINKQIRQEAGEANLASMLIS
jgi:hypothetical protein